MASAAPARSTAGPSAQESSRVTMSYLKEHKLVAVPASSTAVMDALQVEGFKREDEGNGVVFFASSGRRRLKKGDTMQHPII